MSMIAEIRQAARALRRAPGFTMASVLTLALGIGVNTALFSVLNAVLLRPLPYPQPDQLMSVYGLAEQNEQTGLTPADFLDVRRESKSFDGMAAYRSWPRNLLAGDQATQVLATVVTQDFFPLLKQSPALGGLPDSPDQAVISDRLWRTRFGARADLPGQVMQVDGRSITVVGVLPPSFSLPVDGDIWLPSPFAVPPHPLRPEIDLSSNRDENYFEVVARLRPGITREAAAGEINRLQSQIGRIEAGSGVIGAGLESLHDYQVGDSREAILILFGATALLLLIACANLANLALVRFAARERQWLVRAALGATRGRLARAQLTESLLVGVAGGALGLLLAVWGVHVCRALAPVALRSLIDPTPDFRLLGFALGASILAGLGIGMVPLLHLAKDLAVALREGTTGSGDSIRRRRARSLLVISEVALAFLLAVGAGLLVKAFVRIQQVPLGFAPSGVLTFSLTPPRSSYADAAARVSYVDRLREALVAVPGTAGVSVVSRLPLNPGNSRRGYNIEGVAEPATGGPEADYLVSSPGYFNALGISLVKGRDFNEQDRAGAPLVAIVSAQFAAASWPGVDPIGRRFSLGDSTWREVVGVVGDVRQHRLDMLPSATIYMPFAQAPWPSVTVVVRTMGSPGGLTAQVERAVHSVDRGQAIAAVRSMQTVVDDSLLARRFSLLLIGLFAALALILTAVGVYGVIAYSVNQRLRELGIRLALGATPATVLRMVLRNGMHLAGAGLAIGVIGALWLAPVLRGMLYAVAPIDAPTFGVVTLAVLVIAGLATWLPARRAARVDPMSTLRSD